MSRDCASALQQRFLALVNRLRGEHGAAPLQIDAALHAAAVWRAEDMVRRDYFSHDTPGRGMPRDVVTEFGYPDEALTGENICWGENTAEEAFDTWVNSRDHLQNMVSPHYAAIGIGGPAGVQGQDGKWGLWATEFGSLLTAAVPACDGAAPPPPERPAKPARSDRLPKERPPREVRRKRRRGKRRDEAVVVTGGG